MALYFNVEAELERQRRENFHDEEQRLVVIGDGLGGGERNIYASENHIWVRDIGGKSETGFNTLTVPYRVLAGVGYTPIINNQVWIQWEKGPKAWRIHMPDPSHATAVGRSMHLENASDPHNQFHTTEQLLTLKSMPIGNGLASVQGYQFTYNGQYGDYKGTSAVASTHVDLIALQPATTSQLCYCLLVFSPSRFFDDLNPIVTYLSTPQTGALDASDIQECLDQKAADERPIRAYRLDANATEYRGHADDRDVRDWINEPVEAANVYYQTIQGDGVDAPQQPTLNFESSGSVDVTVTDDPSNNRTNVLIEAVAGAGTDTTAIHDNVAGEIAAITAKSSLVGADIFLLEDSAASDAKKSTTLDDIAAYISASSTGGYIHIQDQKSSGTGGGSYTAGSAVTRTLNTIVSDTVGIGSLSSNQFTLPAGTYRFRITVPGYFISAHQAWLYNVTAGAIALRGTSQFSATSVSNASIITGRLTFGVSTTLEVRHQGGFSRGGDGLGTSGGFGTEIYTDVVIEKE